MKKTMVILLFALIILGGCSNGDSNVTREVTFSGEADYWRATIVKEDLDGTDFTLSIKYKGDLEDLKYVHQISYSYKYGTEERRRSENRPDGLSSKKAIVYEDNESTNADYINEQTVIPFKIEWNDKVEEFELKFK
ncbi:hypothetical protein [Lysinibacillus sp. RS5]|uniref:hypothetical protein n=1 Tax=unclassified Lysinibacillus TaxID=2636778 RepID=UPI0035BE4680